MLVLFAALFAFGYIVTPALAVYSWVRWVRSQRRRSTRVRVSLAGLALSSAALLLGIVSVAVSSMHQHVFLYLSPRHGLLYLLGVATSLIAVAVSVVGAFESNPIRMKAVVVAAGAAVFWFLAGSGQ